MTDFLFDGPDDASVSLVLAHGAGAGMESVSMSLFATAFAARGLRVTRFEFDYMAARNDGKRHPPPKAERLIPEFCAAVDAVNFDGTLLIGGKSMGGRVASMAADTLRSEGKVSGLVCLGYPFHPPGKPDQLRTAHLENLETPTLIYQGTRDPFGSREEVVGYQLSSAIELRWMEDGDHDLKPRKKVTGATATEYADDIAAQVALWAAGLR